MSTNGIPNTLFSSLLSSSATSSRSTADLNQLTQDLVSQNPGTNRQDFLTLSEDAYQQSLASAANSVVGGVNAPLLAPLAASSGGAADLWSELQQIGSDLNGAAPSSAQNALLQQGAAALGDAGLASFKASESTSKLVLMVRNFLDAVSSSSSQAAVSSLSLLASLASSTQAASYLEQYSSGNSDALATGASAIGVQSSSSETSSSADLLALLKIRL